MKRSIPFRAAGLGIALVAVLSSCSTFRVASDVSINKVPIDLTFGAEAKLTKPPGAFETLPTIPIPAVTIPLPTPDVPVVQQPPEILCPPHPTAVGARDIAVANPYPIDNYEPKEGTYLWHFNGNYDENPGQQFVDYKVIGDVKPDQNGFDYTIETPFPHYRMILQVIPQDGSDPSNTKQGLYLLEIDYGSKADPTKLLPYIPSPPLKLLDFPLEAGMPAQNNNAVDVSGKEPIGQNPTGGDIRNPSGNTMSSKVQVGEKDQIEACDQYADAWRVNWDLNVTGPYAVHMVGVFWMATAYGGWPARETFDITSDKLIAGSFDNNLMKLDPADYL